MKSKILVKSQPTGTYKFLHIKEYVKIWCIACRELADLSREKISCLTGKKSLTPKREMLKISEICGDRHLI